MSSAPAVSVYATIQWKKEEILRDAKATQQMLKEAFSKGELAAIKVPITFDDKGLQAKLDAAIAKITVKPITVPIVFAPAGSPGGGGGGGSGGGPITGGGGGPVVEDMSSPGSSASMGGPANGPGGVRRPGYSGYFSRGLSRYVAPGILLHEALRGVQAYEKYSSALDHAQITGDLLGGSLKAEEGLQQDIGSIPVVGQAAGLIANLIGDKRGTDRILAQAEVGDRSAKVGGALNAARLHLNLEAAGVGRSEVDTQRAQIAEGRRALEESIAKSTAGLPANLRPDKAIAQARAAYERYAGAVTGRNDLLHENAIQSLATQGAVLEARIAGDPDKAARATMEQRQMEQERALRLKDPGEADKFRDAVAPKEREELEKEIRQRREKEAGDSAARIRSLEGESDEKILKAKGELYAAIEHMIKRTADEHVAALRREADAEKDATRATLLRNEAIAVQRAGVQDLAAIQIERSREGNRVIREAAADSSVDALNATGQHRAARDAGLENKYQEERKRILEAGGPDMYDKLNALNMRHDAQQGLNTRTDTLQKRRLEIETSDAEARGRGQHGVGEVLSYHEEIARMQEDAGGDENRQRAVRRYSNARYSEMMRRLRPQSHTFALDQYHDAIQSSIMNGQGNQEALNLLKAMHGREAVMPTGGAGGNAAGGGGGGMNAAADKLLEAGNRFLKSKAIGVIK